MAMSEHKNTSINNRGGVREGAGRPKGSTNKMSAQTLLDTIATKFAGKSFEENIAEGYFNAVADGDRKMRFEYERLLLGKLVSEKTAVEIEGDLISTEDRMSILANVMRAMSDKDKDNNKD
tara:strand:+ start:122 stop:484 length:363 start_codon:yes stop_codon:yes gene_type:complete